MFEIGKKKFGGFVAELRREKDYTQKELAEKLFISDKAVSKWETGASIPDTTLLIPLSELLGVTVTELLLCERMAEDGAMTPKQAEDAVKTALHYGEEQPMRAYQEKGKWPLCYLCAVALGLAGALLHWLLQIQSITMITGLLLSAVFGGYFCLFVKTRLPAFYDETRCGIYYDGMFRMNMPGVSFNNSNWPHIVRAGRIWSCLFAALYPVTSLVANLLCGAVWAQIELIVFLTLFLGGLFAPMYIVGRKYE